MDKLQEINELLKGIRDKKEDDEKKASRINPFMWALSIAGAVLIIAGFAYAVYRYFTPDYLEDFNDEDFEDDFDDYFDENDKDDDGKEDSEEKKEEDSSEKAESADGKEEQKAE